MKHGEGVSSDRAKSISFKCAQTKLKTEQLLTFLYLNALCVHKWVYRLHVGKRLSLHRDKSQSVKYYGAYKLFSDALQHVVTGNKTKHNKHYIQCTVLNKQTWWDLKSFRSCGKRSLLELGKTIEHSCTNKNNTAKRDQYCVIKEKKGLIGETKRHLTRPMREERVKIYLTCPSKG